MDKSIKPGETGIIGQPEVVPFRQRRGNVDRSMRAEQRRCRRVPGQRRSDRGEVDQRGDTVALFASLPDKAVVTVEGRSARRNAGRAGQLAG